MEPKKVIASIKIIPIQGTTNKANIEIETPIWHRIDAKDGKIYINLALFGGITTIADSVEDMDDAIKEALTCFFHAAQNQGKGIKEELSLLGWVVKRNERLIRYKVNKQIRKDRPATSYNLPNVPPIYAGVMQTGTLKSISLKV